MNKEVISDKQGIAIMILFIIGESAIFVTGIGAGEDLWIAIILSFFMVLPLIFIYIKLFNIYPDKDLFFLIEKCFGKLLGKVIILLYTLYAFELANLSAINFGQFVNTVSFPQTPFIIPAMVLILLCSWVVKEGIEVIGRCAEFFVILPIVLVLLTILLLIPNMNLDNIRPILFNGIKPVIKGAYEVFIYPFGETVILIFAFSTLKNKKSISKIYKKGILIGGLILLITSLTIVLVLGVKNSSNTFYPGYLTFTRVNIGKTLQRVEIVSSFSFLLVVFIKASIHLLIACKGIAVLFGFKDYRFIVTPIALLVINLTYFEFDGVLSFFEWTFEIWIHYDFIFIAILPVIIFIVFNIRKRHIL